jgi:hypothetical protein
MTLSVLLASALAALDEGGKLPWQKPADKQFDQTFAQAKRSGKPIVLYFTSKG